MSKPPAEGTFLSSFSSPEAIRNFSCQVIFSSPKSHWISTSQCCEVDFCREIPAAGEGRHKLRGDCQRKGICSLIYVRLGKAREAWSAALLSGLQVPQILAWSSAGRKIRFAKFVAGSCFFFFFFLILNITILLGLVVGTGRGMENLQIPDMYWIQPQKHNCLCSISTSAENSFLGIPRPGKKTSQTLQTIKTFLHAIA